MRTIVRIRAIACPPGEPYLNGACVDLSVAVGEMRKRVVETDPCGLVQVVQLHWGKSSRGGQAARNRNAVPQAFAVPAADLAAAGGHLCVSVTHWGERNAFTEPFLVRRERVAVADGFTFGCVGVSPHPEGLLVRYQYTRTDGGAPDRWFFNWFTVAGESPGRPLVVRPGQWVRVCYNGRFSCIDSGNWWYEQSTVNVVCFGGEPDGRVFIDREPAEELRVLADLW